MENDQNLPNLLDLSDELHDSFWESLSSVINIPIPQEVQPNSLPSLPDFSGIMIPQQTECDSTISVVQQSPQLMQPSPHLNQPQLPEDADSDVLTRPNFEGFYGFRVVFPSEDMTRCSKDSSWTFSALMNELFTKMDADCPVQVHLNGPVPYSSFIRVSPHYRKAEDDQNGVPKRCLLHKDARDQSNRDHQFRKHLIRSYMPGSEHVMEQGTKRREVLLPCNSSYSANLLTYVIRFMCRSSCSGGMNRRPFCVVFTLEHNGTCLGRHVQKVHVSASPRRDRRNGEKRLENSGGVRTRPVVPLAVQNNPVQSQVQPLRQPGLARDVKKACKRIASTSSGGRPRKEYKLFVNSRKVYDILCATLKLLDASMKSKDVSSTEDEN